MFEKWNPDAYYGSIGLVPAAELLAKGYQLLLVDIDNTLQKHGSHEPQEEAIEQIDRFLATGFQVYILSNARLDRASNFGRNLKVQVIGNAGKPGIRGVEEALLAASVPRERTILIGDQLFTDIWSGTRAGVKTVLLDPISHHEPWYIRAKRLGERLVKRKLGITGHYDRIPEVR